mmetsp:Transcript_117998/g.330425  ORF Transcript_117998/g.330425 Transcript_117998/m.330425 type:complete len:208 (+) Transcript_117998:922-1545(+)
MPHASQSVGKDGVESVAVDDAAGDVRAKVQATRVGPQGRGVLHAVSSVQPIDARVIDPSHAELNETLGFDQRLRGKGVLGIAVEDRRQALHGRCDRLDVFLLVTVAALGFADQQVGRLHTGLETDITLPTEQRLVSPRLGHFHGLMHTFLIGQQGLFRFLNREGANSRRHDGSSQRGSGRAGDSREHLAEVGVSIIARNETLRKTGS